MRPHKPLTPEQTRKAISMHKEGATHADICAALHVPKHQIGEVITAWLRDNMQDLQNALRLCKKRPRVSRRLECATCIKIVRRFANEVTPCS